MIDRKIDELTEKAKEVMNLIKELQDLAAVNDFGLCLEESRITFEDWLSSDCYGEGTSEEFGVYNNGEVWRSSSC